MEQKLCDAAIKGDVEALHEIIKEDKLILDKVVVGTFKGTSPLHIAASIGKTEFVEQLLLEKPELARVVDSRLQSALHLASAEGHLMIVRALVKLRPQMCQALDRDGNNPLHIAAMMGNDDVLKALVEASPHAAQVKAGCGGNILHICVKHNQLNALKELLDSINDKEFVNSKDTSGRTILHLAVSGKQFKIVKCVLENKKIEVNATNADEHTALDVILLLAKDEKLDSNDAKNKELQSIEDILRIKKAKKAEDLLRGEWLTKKQESLMIVASLMAAMAFQAAVNPPGGVWQDDSNGHRAGEAVMAYNYPDSYPYFLRSNTIGFVTSLSIILLLITGLPYLKRYLMWLLVMIMWLTITTMAFTYAFASVVVTPKKDRKALSDTIVVAVIAWCSVMVLLLAVHLGRWIEHILKEQWSKWQAKKRISKDNDDHDHRDEQRCGSFNISISGCKP